MSNWKLDYIRMWQLYYGKDMQLNSIDKFMNNNMDSFDMLAHINGYKFGKLLEAVGKLKFPN